MPFQHAFMLNNSPNVLNSPCYCFWYTNNSIIVLCKQQDKAYVEKHVYFKCNETFIMPSSWVLFNSRCSGWSQSACVCSCWSRLARSIRNANQSSEKCIGREHIHITVRARTLALAHPYEQNISQTAYHGELIQYPFACFKCHSLSSSGVTCFSWWK